MVEQKTKEAAPKTAVKKPAATLKKKSLAYGRVKFRASLYRGKWRFVNSAEVVSEKKKSAKLAKLKEQGVQIKEKKKSRPSIVKKPIKGEKNGESREIHLKRKNYYPSIR